MSKKPLIDPVELENRRWQDPRMPPPEPPPPPEPSLHEQLHAARQSGYQDGYRDGMAALDAFKQSFAKQMSQQIGALVHGFDTEMRALEDDMAAAVARIAEESAAALRTPELRARLAEQGSEPVGSTPDQFAAFIRTEIPKWTEMVRLSGATAE